MTVLAMAAPGCAADDGEVVAGDDELFVETGEFEVGTGDVFECFYTDVITDRELATTGAFGDQVGVGGHHITIYYTTNVRPPEHHPCTEEEMTAWQMVGGTGSEASEPLSLTEGLAMKIPAGAQIVFQTHYINTTDERYTVNEQVGIRLIAPEDVTDYVHQFVVINSDFAVPPHQKVEASGTCTLSQDVKLVRLLGHMHEWGTRYQLEEVDEEGTPMRSLTDDDVTPVYASHPPISVFSLSEPLVLTKGTRLRQTCNWNNYEEYELKFPREMCVSFGLYFGGEADVYCLVK